MVRVDPERQQQYEEAYAAWQRQLLRLHEVFLDGAPLPPPQLKGLLNREARAKERYDAAREALLGIGSLPQPDRFSGRLGRAPAPALETRDASDAIDSTANQDGEHSR